MEKEWETLKGKYHFSSFHMSEFAARNPKSEFAQLSDDAHARLFRRVREVCKKYAVHTVSVTVNKKDYDEVVPEEFRKYSGRFHYTWAVRSLLNHIAQWRNERAVPPLEYVFDWMGKKRKNPRRREIEDVLDQAAEAAQANGEFAHWGFHRREDLPGLQCTDLIAWATYQLALFAYSKKGALHPLAKLAWEDFKKHKGGMWGYHVTVTRANLQRWVDSETRRGRSLERLKARQEQKTLERSRHGKK